MPQDLLRYCVMWNDVIDLRDFYESQLGQVAQGTITQAIGQLWPDLTGQSLLGLGYATPYLTPYQGRAERVLACMPAGQGVLHWPSQGPGAVTLAYETELPLPSYSIDRVLLVHGLECSEALRAMLHEIWRVLTGSGRLLVVVPNRRGIWARFDRTPFGWGHPYSAAQLSRMLRENLFTPGSTQRALYLPPTGLRPLLRSAAACERVGRRLFPTFSGVVLVECGKQVYAASPAKRKARSRKPVVVPFPQVAGRVPPKDTT